MSHGITVYVRGATVSYVTWPTARQTQVGAAFLLGGICAYGAIRASFFFITDYALQTGWPASHAYLLPLCLDALAATGFLIYGLTRKGFPFAVGVGAIVVSMLFNGASHWFTTGQTEPTWLWITSGAFIPALSAGLIVHMVTEWLNPKPEGRTRSRTRGFFTQKASSSSAPSSGTASKKAGLRTRVAARTTTGGASGVTRVVGTGPYSTWTQRDLKLRTDEEIVATARELGLTGTTPWALVTPLRVTKDRAKRLQPYLTNGASRES